MKISCVVAFLVCSLAVATASCNTNLFAINANTNQLTELNPADLSLINTVTVGFSGSAASGLAFDGKTVYQIAESQQQITLSTYNVNTGAESTQDLTGVISSPGGLGYLNDKLYALQLGTKKVVVLDTAGNKEATLSFTINDPSEAFVGGLACAGPRGTCFFNTVRDGNAAVIYEFRPDGSTTDFTRTVPLPATGLGFADNKLYLEFPGTVVALELVDGSTLTTLLSGAEQFALAGDGACADAPCNCVKSTTTDANGNASVDSNALPQCCAGKKVCIEFS